MAVRCDLLPTRRLGTPLAALVVALMVVTALSLGVTRSVTSPGRWRSSCACLGLWMCLQRQ